MPFKPPPTKAAIRDQLQREIRQYLEKGGTVSNVPRGLSGRDENRPLKTVLFDTPREPRTYVNDLVMNIDQRKKPKKPEHKKTPSPNRGRYEIIYDDFGEPLRKVWVDK